MTATPRYINAKNAAIKWQTETTFETDPSTGSPPAPANLLRLAQDIKLDLGMEVIAVDPQKSSDARGPDASVAGGKGGKLTFSMPLITGASSPVVGLMKVLAGVTSSTIAQHSSKVTGGSTNTIVALTADVSDISVGEMIIHNSAAGTDSCRFVTKKAADTPAPGSTTLTVSRAFPNATQAVSGDTIEASTTITPASTVIGDTTSLTFYVYFGVNGSTNVWLAKLTGCSGTFKLASAGPKALLMINFDINISSWSHAETAPSAQTAASGNSPITALGASLVIDTASPVVDSYATRSFSFDPGIQIQELVSLSTNGRSGWFSGDCKPVADLSLVHDNGWFTKYGALTSFSLVFDRFISTSNCFAIWLPKCEIVKAGHEEEGIRYVKPTINVLDPEVGPTAGNTDLLPRWAIGFSG